WGRIWDGYLSGALQTAADFFKNTLGKAVDGLSDSLGFLSGNAGQASASIVGIGQGFDGSKKQGNDFLSWGTVFGAAIGTVFGGPVGAVFGGILGSMTNKFWPGMKSAWSGGWNYFKDGVTEFGSWLPGAISRSAAGAWAGITRMTDGISDHLKAGLPEIRFTWSGFWDFALQLTKNIGSGIKQVVGTVVSSMKRGFVSAVDGMRSAWNRIPDAFKAPINWMINKGYNDGIHRMWNSVIGWLHLPSGL
ncbi:hypothetical protein, partial [Actinomadura sp. RB99]|uniref:hypothetical protein n=1 Tax=Actinomadura sp. RB99 TaxID=2691577 RepID=UPI0016899E51